MARTKQEQGEIERTNGLLLARRSMQAGSPAGEIMHRLGSWSNFYYANISFGRSLYYLTAVYVDN